MQSSGGCLAALETIMVGSNVPAVSFRGLAARAVCMYSLHNGQCIVHNAPMPPPPQLPAWCSYDFFGGQEAVLGQHEAAVKCVEWLPSRGLLVSGSWDRCGGAVG